MSQNEKPRPLGRVDVTNAERARMFDLAAPEPADFGTRPTRLQVEVGPGFVTEWHPASDEVPVRIVRGERGAAPDVQGATE